MVLNGLDNTKVTRRLATKVTIVASVFTFLRLKSLERDREINDLRKLSAVNEIYYKDRLLQDFYPRPLAFVPALCSRGSSKGRYDRISNTLIGFEVFASLVEHDIL